MSPETLKKPTVYETLFENAFSAMLIVDPETFLILDANQAALKFYQYSKGEMLGLNLSAIHTLTKKEIQKEMRDITRQKRQYFNYRHRLKNGDIKDVEVHSGPIEFEDKNVLYCIIHDISGKKLTHITRYKTKEYIKGTIFDIDRSSGIQ